MDVYERIQQSVQYIESHLQQDLQITDIASKAFYSAFHFQRLFHSITGFSVHQYIRRRRLTEAAVNLLEDRNSILEIALSYQYGSQEAFTRAFQSMFGLSPAQYRQTSFRDVQCQHAINLLDYKTKSGGDFYMYKPEFVELDPIRIIAREYQTNLNNEKHYEEIPGFYEDFGRKESYLYIPNQAAPGMAYGISAHFQDNGDFTFMVGEEVSCYESELAEEFVRFTIPAGKYAKFKGDGPAGHVADIRNFIYGTWFPNSNYERREGPDFEVTDVMRSRPEHMVITIYIPLV
ncbi:AraC family transcriptional regulator [Paenibacillus lutrae]|uniref:Helix-turn-helix domain-containing protein n=1 Tax=Paenibacillus lutrae TaxID=2078573 RepID=A0A7X3FE89_9BACL|nr:effector binding domain-containing protein [Paenibacillus lutrae]MVO98062.1 helix-turn-helix domain-containing protein [Paenibacillus lutrae]